MARKRRSCSRLCVMLVAIAFFYASGIKVTAAQENTICNGVIINGIDIGGMTKEKAQDTMESYVEELQKKEVAIALDEEIALTTVGDLGYAYEENTYLDEAFSLGKVGNLIKRYKEIKDVENDGIEYELVFHLDPVKVDEFLTSQCSQYDQEAVNASVQRVNGQFVYTKEITGRKLNVEKTSQLLQDALLNEWNCENVAIDAVIEDDIPQYTYEDVQKCNTLLGTFTTNYSTSSSERKSNIANASRLMTNAVVYPGEIYSCYENMAPFTRENGYHSAHAYINGMVEDSIGGGVCQVSTTLYNALLRAELEIVERAAHSMTVSYVDVSFDAAIAGNYKDLKFRNNLDVPVIIEAIANGTTITFNVYGNETRSANRKVEYKSEVLSKTEPPKDVITEDPNQPTTYHKVTQSAYTGYVAVLYKYVYENGALVSKTQINKSTYKASPNYITVGTMVVEEEELEEENPEENKPDKDEEPDKDDNPDKDEKPNSTEKPDKDPDKEPDMKPEQEDTAGDDTSDKEDETVVDESDTDAKEQDSEARAIPDEELEDE